jgi:hypothetical protein
MRNVRLVSITLLAVVAIAMFAAPAFATPPGNNGDVKIEFTGTQPPNMEPHVPCTFNIEFRGYDEGNLTGTYSFALQPPTGTDVVLTGSTAIGEDPAGGANDLDASVPIDLGPYLAGVTPHPQQGYHVKVTVDAQGSIGADTKYKVFWVKCGPSYVPGPTATGDTLNAASSAPTHTVDWTAIALIALLLATPILLVGRRIRRFAKAGDAR